MKRYQVYLNPYSVAILDDFEKISDLSRSKIIREAIDRLAEALAAVLAATDRKSSRKRYVLDDLAGFIDLKTKKKTHLAENVDDIYSLSRIPRVLPVDEAKGNELAEGEAFGYHGLCPW